MDELEPCKVHWCLAKKPGREYELMSTKGICLEEVGIPSVGHVVVNRTIKPRVGDIVWCNDWRCCISGYLKQVKSFDGNAMIVTTRYKDRAKDFSFYVCEFYGVVELAFDQIGRLCYRRPEIGITTSMEVFQGD